MELLSSPSGELYFNGITMNNVFERKPCCLIKYKGYSYYYIDLKAADLDSIGHIIDSCDRLEKDCWNPQSNFRDYIKKSHHLIYAEFEKEIVGFQLTTFPIYGRDQVISIDEVMVRDSHQKSKVALKFCSLAFCMGLKMAKKNKEITHVIWLGISCSPRVITSCHKGDPITGFFPNTFNPSQELIRFQDQYIKDNGLELVNEKYNFFLKNVFPCSNKQKGEHDGLNDSENLLTIVPPGFDHMERGDALMYAVRIGKRINRIAVLLMMFKNFGFSFIYKNFGLKRRTELIYVHNELVGNF